jgi:hypothetical protein
LPRFLTVISIDNAAVFSVTVMLSHSGIIERTS